jgi:hypothetical protein
MRLAHEEFVTRPHVPPSSASSPHLTRLPFSVQGLRQDLWLERRGCRGGYVVNITAKSTEPHRFPMANYPPP